jgi:hypothetical protein
MTHAECASTRRVGAGVNDTTIRGRSWYACEEEGERVEGRGLPIRVVTTGFDARG